MTLRSCTFDLYRRGSVDVNVDVDVLDQSTGRRPDGRKRPAQVHTGTTSPASISWLCVSKLSLTLVSCCTSYPPSRNAFDYHLAIVLAAAGVLCMVRHASLIQTTGSLADRPDMMFPLF